MNKNKPKNKPREIKFRAWNMGEMYYSDFIVKANGVVLWWESEKGYRILSDCPIMQFTGLKDSHGVEIYEGDILRYESNTGMRNAAVYWRHDALSYRMRASLEDGGPGEIMEIPRMPENREIVGNIYENPELLKQK